MSAAASLETCPREGVEILIFVVLPSINFPVVVHYSWIIKSELLIQRLIFKCSQEERPISQAVASYKTFGLSDEISPPGFGYRSIVCLFHLRVALRTSFIDRIQIGH